MDLYYKDQFCLRRACIGGNKPKDKDTKLLRDEKVMNYGSVSRNEQVQNDLRYRINRTRSLLQCGGGEREIGGEKMHR